MGVASLQQHDERPGPDAADADDLAGHVHDLEALQQVPPVILQGGPVGAELLVDRRHELAGGQAVGGGQVTRRDHDRRLADDPVVPIDQLAELGQRLQAVTRVRLRGGLLRPLPGQLGRLSCFRPVSPVFFFAAFAPLASFLVSATVVRIAPISSSSSRWAYQMSIVPICAKEAIASR